MSEPIVNKHGRKGGRGMRPWLLIPKVLAVGVYVGSLTTCAVIYLTRDADRTGQVVEQIGWLFRFLVVPALLAASALGVALLFEHPRVLLRLRWLRVKLICLAVGVPAAHVFMASRLGALREALHAGASYEGLDRQMTCGFVAVLVFAALIVWLGRHKPRLGQNWAKTLAAAQKHE